ncbi:MAG: type III secretion protein [Proteobacteria bacterium]|nr:type III secretion protein [Cystobacterineae bacterium]MCL2258762.1 type III secretion protein [Cystobacterineae bacterium]MCL2314381.1 type III secretion protein [Pseudomonadota bacterium]
MFRKYGFAALLGMGLFACTENLQHDLSEEEANEIYVLLQRNGISATKQRGGEDDKPVYTISVAKADAVNAFQLLTDHSLPRARSDGLSLFKKNKGMIPTQVEERAMLLEALGGEISNALNRIPGVLEVRTLVMLPEANDLVLEADKPRPSASVFMKYRASGEEKPPIEEAAIQNFVAAAVPQLAPGAVQILMVRAAPPQAELDIQQRLQVVLGLQMTKDSAGQFRIIVAVGALLMLLMLFICIWIVLKGRAAAKVE